MQPRIWAVVPAAGAGRRMLSAIPKQYLQVAGACVLEHTLRALLTEKRIDTVVVAISAEDEYFESLTAGRDPRVSIAPGGAERADSVRNALQSLVGRAEPEDLVLVHDAARPCLARAELRALIDAALADPVGAILALPVRDTVKRSDAHGRIAVTVPRDDLWRAQTPQAFRFEALLGALENAGRAGVVVTDEAQAMERIGANARLVTGSERNIKLTVAEDLALLERYLQDMRAGGQ
ncbi:MAG: 2-C-methyl-D-erythritol 4-phosphate cytidylyltransferase [Gammaproteobacteria bacterium]|nr:2-C-methyl-D-erythritol 4-phosphate cytidylyltransferase [Gammaproteobacteria bacterium]